VGVVNLGLQCQWGWWGPGQLKKLILEIRDSEWTQSRDALDSGATDASVWMLCGH
jgi:hypothetical protein